MSTPRTLRIWRGDATGGALVDYTAQVDEGEGVLDAVLSVQAGQAGDLAVRWNCKAGKCGSCSAEINGYPKLMCMTRLSSLPPGEPVTVTSWVKEFLDPSSFAPIIDEAASIRSTPCLVSTCPSLSSVATPSRVRRLTSTSTRPGTSGASAPNSVTTSTRSFSFDVNAVTQAQYPMAPRTTGPGQASSPSVPKLLSRVNGNHANINSRKNNVGGELYGD